MGQARPSRGGVTRRKTAGRRPATKSPVRASAQAPAVPKGKPGGRLKAELVLPVGIGALVLCGALGIVAVGSEKVGAPLPLTLAVAGIVLTAALVAYVSWVTESVVARPLARVRDALEEMEGGNYDTRLAADGALELCEVQQGFNRMATIVGHQRERLKVAAATDGLTGLSNHRHFHEQLRLDGQAARDNKLPLCVVALDIDGF